MDLRRIERRIVVGSRFVAILAVIGSLAGSVLMFFLGSFDIYKAYAEGLRTGGEPGEFGTAAVILVIEGLDRFLIAIVLLYFAYGVYSLCIHPGESEERLALPDWLRVRQIGQLKQVVAEVIVVILLVLFLRMALQAFHSPLVELSWRQIGSMALLPFSIVMISLALRLVELHPKPGRPVAGLDTTEERAEAPSQTSQSSKP